MTLSQIAAKAGEIQELKRMREELDAEISAAENAIKAEMGDREQLVAGAFRILWKTYQSSHVDTAALKRELPEIAARFTRSCAVRRFSIT